MYEDIYTNKQQNFPTELLEEAKKLLESVHNERFSDEQASELLHEMSLWAETGINEYLRRKQCKAKIDQMP